MIFKLPEQCLIDSGYVPHKNGTHAGGYVRDVGEKGDRYHAHVSFGNRIDIHYDKNIKGFHHSRLPVCRKRERKEVRRIRFVWSQKHKQPVKIKKLKPMKVEYAKNLRELQKRKPVIHYSLWERVRMFISRAML